MLDFNKKYFNGLSDPVCSTKDIFRADKIKSRRRFLPCDLRFSHQADDLHHKGLGAFGASFIGAYRGC